MGILQRRPYIADLVFNRDGAGGTYSGALTAINTFGFGHFSVKGGHNAQLRTSVNKIQYTHALNFVTDAHTVAAENAFVGIADN
ncbi:hypothetical protein DSECCO2_630950 [anaerobic digester metagenome]